MAYQDLESTEKHLLSDSLLKRVQPHPPLGRSHSFRPFKFLLALGLAGLLALLTMKTQLLCMILPAHAIASAIPEVVPKPLMFGKNGVFKITVFNDMHFGEGEDNPPDWGWGPPSDLKTTKVMETILDIETRDLVVLNGDLITGENTHRDNSTKYFDQIVAPMVQRQQVWASTYGNHDNQFNLSTQFLLRREKEYRSLSMTRDMVDIPEAGVSNYYLEVLGNGYGPALILWFFDSRGGSRYQETARDGGRVGIDGVVHNATTAWFIKTQEELKTKYGRAIPSLAFVHIPVSAMRNLQTAGIDPHLQPGINDDDPFNPQDKIKSGPFMQALLKAEGLMAVFSGHQHGNDWCARERIDSNSNGVFFCFGGHTGYGGYGRWMRDSRQIVVNEATLGKEIFTWLRREDKSVSANIVLNATYGSDVYPAVEHKYTRRRLI